MIRTAGKPVALKLTKDYDDGEMCFFQVDAVDAAGVRHPLAENRLSFSVTGPGRILAVGNGNPRAMEPFADASAHSLFFGKATVGTFRRGAALTACSIALPAIRLTAGGFGSAG